MSAPAIAQPDVVPVAGPEASIVPPLVAPHPTVTNLTSSTVSLGLQCSFPLLPP